MDKRYLTDIINQDALAEKKIAFISGPRQIGKTTLAQQILTDKKADNGYFSWDDDEFKKIWAKNPKLILEATTAECLVLDEIHKDRQWKNKLKGIYDLYKNKKQFIVTGSARMDFFRKSGDSLQGRYFPYRLHPFTLGESETLKPPPSKNWENHGIHPSYKLDDLLQLSGFPEPLFSSNSNKALRWRKLYHERMVKEEVRDLQNIRNISNIENLSVLLRDRAAGQLSYAALKEDLSCSFDSILKWIDILEAVYYCYRIRPYSKKIKNSLKKEPKLYFTNWTFAQDTGAAWENLIAGHLLKNVQAWTDSAMGEFELFYLRDKQKREVDFFITKNAKPYLLLEVKSNQTTPTKSLIYYNEILKPEFCIQLVKDTAKERKASMAHPKIQIMEASRFLQVLN